MKFPSNAIIERLKKEYPAGYRVKLIEMDDIHAPAPGTLGTVQGVDDAGSIMVHWDNGSGLSIVYGVDRCRKLPQCPLCGEYYAAQRALSRADNKTQICPTCGIRQALQAAGLSDAEQQKIIDSIYKK